MLIYALTHLSILIKSANAFIIVAGYSFISYLKSIGKPPAVHFEKTYDGQKIMLIALYEKGRLRDDIVNLLKVAKASGMYVLAINNLKLEEPDATKTLIDTYIERNNYGRDFGSYKTGFNHIFQKGWHLDCPRLLMVNDSIYFSKKTLPTFISNLMDSEIEVLGATENNEIRHHLGSFCIAFSNRILIHSKFIKYWERYKKSDIRPVVIRRGEMKLSDTLKKCVSSPINFRAFYDIAWFSSIVRDNTEFLHCASDYYRTSKLVSMPNPSLQAATDAIVGKQTKNSAAIPGTSIDSYSELEIVNRSELKNEFYYFDDFDSLVSKVLSNTEVPDLVRFKQRVLKEIKSNLLENFSKGSQIHQNGILLHALGMSIIKLDGVYRGVYVSRDVEVLADQMDPTEVEEFTRLLYSKPFGKDVLFGWKRAAFSIGLI